MRLLRLDFGQGLVSIDLHPFVTIVRGLDELQQGELLETIRGLARGSAAGLRGLVQNQGLLVELDGAGEVGLVAVTGANVVIDCDAAADAGAAGANANLDRLRRRAEIDAVLVEEIRADLSPSTRARVVAIEQQLAPEDEGVVAEKRRVEALVLGGIERVEVTDPLVYTAPDGLLELRQRWFDHRNRRATAEDHFAELMAPIQAAEVEASAAREALVAADEAAKPALLDRDEEARLEALSFPEQDDTRKGKWRKTLRPEEEDEKSALLAKVGVDSWTAYTLYRAHPTPHPDRLEVADAARKALTEAEASLAEARASLANDALTSDLNDEGDAIRNDARPLLGQLLPTDLTAAFDEQIVGEANPVWIEAVDRLAAAVQEVGGSAPARPMGASEATLAEAEGMPAEVTAWGEQVVAAGHQWIEDRRQEATKIDVEALQTELISARSTLGRHERALVRLNRVETAAAASVRRHQEVADQLAAVAEGGPGAIDAVLALVRPIASQVEAEGSVPIAILGQFAAIDDVEVADLLDELDRIAEHLQVLVVSEHPAAAAWAETTGLKRAAVARPKALAANPNA